MTATVMIPTTRMIRSMMAIMVVGSLSALSVQPAALRTSEGMLVNSQMFVSVSSVAEVLSGGFAYTVGTIVRPSPNRQTRVTKAVLMILVFFMNLLCDGCIFDKAGILASVTNGARDEGSDDFGESDNSEADESVHDSFLGFFDFAWVTGGG